MSQYYCPLCDSMSPAPEPPDAGEWKCPQCGAEYGYNEGFMLSASWAAGEIKRLQRKLLTQADEIQYGIRERTACPPDTDLDHWLGVLRRCWEDPGGGGPQGLHTERRA